MGSKYFTLNWEIYRTQLSSRQPISVEEDFYALILEAVDEALAMLIGSAGRQTFYFGLKASYGIKKENIPLNIKLFAKAIEETFGEGARLIEVEILKRLYNKAKERAKLDRFEIHPDCNDDLNFIEYINALKKLYKLASAHPTEIKH